IPSMMPMSRWWLMSFSCATGSTRRSTNSRTVSWIARWSSVRSKSTATRSLAATRTSGPDPNGGLAGARHLGGVHRPVGGAEERGGVGAGVRADGDAEAGAQARQATGQDGRHRGGDAADDGVRLGLV